MNRNNLYPRLLEFPADQFIENPEVVEALYEQNYTVQVEHFRDWNAGTLETVPFPRIDRNEIDVGLCLGGVVRPPPYFRKVEPRVSQDGPRVSCDDEGDAEVLEQGSDAVAEVPLGSHRETRLWFVAELDQGTFGHH